MSVVEPELQCGTDPHAEVPLQAYRQRPAALAAPHVPGHLRHVSTGCETCTLTSRGRSVRARSCAPVVRAADLARSAMQS